MSVHRGGRGFGHIARAKRGASVAVLATTLNDRNWVVVTPDTYATRSGQEGATTKAVDSLLGSDAAAGGYTTPKQTIGAVAALVPNDVLGLYRGSFWRENIPLAAITGKAGIVAQDLAHGDYTQAMPVVSAMDLVATGAWTNNGDGTYTTTWTAAETLLNDGYSNVYVTEINIAAEASTPIASQRRMDDATSQANAAANAGSSFVESLGSNQWRATMRPTSGAPGGTYRYEVVARYNVANWPPGNTDGTMRGIKVIGQSQGYGLSGSKNFDGSRLIVMHATTHTGVIGSGTLSRSLFYGHGNINNFGLVFYTADGTGLSWSIDHCFFYDSAPSAFYTHTSGVSYASGSIADLVVVGKRRADGALMGSGVGGSNNNSITVRRVYVEGHNVGLAANGASVIFDTRDSIFRRCGTMALTGVFKNNIVQVEQASDPTDLNKRGCNCMTTTAGNPVDCQNNLFAALSRTDSTGFIDEAGAFGVLGDQPQGTISKNIFLLRAGTTGAQVNFVSGAQPFTHTSDYNVYILARGAFGIVGNIGTDDWAAFKTFTGQDANSLFVDVRSDPLGVKAVFVDPDNGDFRWSDTVTGAAVKAYCDTNGVGPTTGLISRWPSIPTVDQIADLIRDAIEFVFTSPAAASVVEGNAWNQTLTATKPATFAIVGGADQSLFSLAGSVLSLASKVYATPVDADANNTYVVQVRATDSSGGTVTQTITVTVTEFSVIPDKAVTLTNGDQVLDTSGNFIITV